MKRTLFLVLALLSGCLPRAMAPSSSADIPVEDCAAWGAPGLEKRLDRLTGSRERAGNRAELLIDGVNAFARRYENSADAEFILVKTFIFYDDETGRAVAKLLSERARAGVEVWFQYDFKASVRGVADVMEMLALASPELRLGEPPLVRAMRDAGVHVVASYPPRRPSRMARWGEFVEAWSEAEGGSSPVGILPRFDHEKYWITANPAAGGGLELRAILGGMNVASEYAYGGTTRRDSVSGRGGWRDTDVELRGPVTNDIVHRYLDLVELHRGKRLAPAERERLNPVQAPMGDAAVRFVWNHPNLGNKRRIERLYGALLRATPDGAPIRIATAYFAPGRRIARPLHRALADGSPLSVITNSADSADVWFVATASRVAYRRIVRVEPEAALYEWRAREAEGGYTFHAKQAAFGDCGPVIVGSANLDAQSSEHNSESVVAIRDPALRAEFDAMFAADLAEGRVTRLDPEALLHPGWAERVRQAMVYSLFWYLVDDHAGPPRVRML